MFCGSSSGADPRFRAAAEGLGRELAGAGVALVYGGGAVGLMGALADACLGCRRRGRRRHPEGAVPARGRPHGGLTTLHEVASMHERKQLMYDLADGFVALPGGLGTLEELAEVLTWNQLGIVAKPVVLLDVAGTLGRAAGVARAGRRRRVRPCRARRRPRPRRATSPTCSPPSPPPRCRGSTSGSTWRRRDGDEHPVGARRRNAAGRPPLGSRRSAGWSRRRACRTSPTACSSSPCPLVALGITRDPGRLRRA